MPLGLLINTYLNPLYLKLQFRKRFIVKTRTYAGTKKSFDTSCKKGV